MKAWRAWSAGAARTVNAGHYTSTALKALMTAGFAKTMKNILGPDVGYYFPGPIPYRPLRVSIVSSTVRESQGCLVVGGFVTDAKTHKPAGSLLVRPVLVRAVQQSGRWVIDNEIGPEKFSCAHVKVAMPRW